MLNTELSTRLRYLVDFFRYLDFANLHFRQIAPVSPISQSYRRDAALSEKNILTRLCQKLTPLSSTVDGHFFIRPYGFEPIGHFIIHF